MKTLHDCADFITIQKKSVEVIMKKLVVFCGAIILSVSVIAQEAEDFNVDEYLTQSDSESSLNASKQVIQVAAETCRSWAKDDEVEEIELASYLLNCVNEELTYQGYSPITSINWYKTFA